MREIKFRAWDKVSKKMINNHLSCGVELNSNFNNPASSWIYMQFTGLKDKNGKEIYEGDILLTDEAGWKAPVVYKNGAFILLIEKPFSEGGGFSTEPNWKECEVIGNIWEHPELLK